MKNLDELIRNLKILNENINNGNLDEIKSQISVNEFNNEINIIRELLLHIKNIVSALIYSCDIESPQELDKEVVASMLNLAVLQTLMNIDKRLEILWEIK